MSSKLCYFNAVLKSDCGASRGLEGLTFLRECNEDVGMHLVSCHLSKESLTERELILARAGLYSLSETQIKKMSVCPKHRHSLGRFWRPPGTCQHPDHTGKSTSATGKHVIGLKLAKEIHDLYGRNAPVGSRK